MWSQLIGADALIDSSHFIHVYLHHLLAHVINSMLTDSEVSIHYSRDTEGRTCHTRLSSHFIVHNHDTDRHMYHTRLSSHFIIHSRDTDRRTNVLYMHGSHTILTVYVGLAQAHPNNVNFVISHSSDFLNKDY